jgi:Flp pilus assembly protein CpaB
LLVALAAMLCGVGLLHLYMRAFEARASGGAMHSVLVATGDAQAGEIVTRDMLGLRELPEAYLESRHILERDLDKVVGSTLAVATRANETLLWSDVAGMGQQPRSLASLVRPGMRAFTLATAEGSLRGLLQPGDRVDVLSVLQAGNSVGPRAARTLLENLMVLAIDARTGVSPAAELGAGSGATSACRVTLSVTNAQGQELATAERAGPLRLLLRNPGDVVIAGPSTQQPLFEEPAQAPAASGVP